MKVVPHDIKTRILTSVTDQSSQSLYFKIVYYLMMSLNLVLLSNQIVDHTHFQIENP
jgi:hypothetical protein